MAKVLTVRLLLDVDSDAEAFDAGNEILREQQRDFALGSCLVDYAFDDSPLPTYPVREGYEEGEFI